MRGTRKCTAKEREKNGTNRIIMGNTSAEYATIQKRKGSTFGTMSFSL